MNNNISRRRLLKLVFGVGAAGLTYIRLPWAQTEKVVRIALLDAASVSGLLITVEALITDKPEKAPPAPQLRVS